MTGYTETWISLQMNSNNVSAKFKKKCNDIINEAEGK